MAGKRKYERSGFYDEKAGAWKSYYINPAGKIVAKKEKSYNALKENIQKNYNPKLSLHIKTKKESPIIAARLNNTLKIQKAIDKELKKLSETGTADFKRLEKNILDTNYKPEILNRIPRTIKPNERSYKKDFLDFTYRGVQYKKPLWIGKKSFQRLKGYVTMKHGSLKGYNKYQLEIGSGKNKISGVMTKADFQSQEKFEQGLKRLTKENPGLQNKKYEKMQIIIKGIKY